jgi:hypothetical protein
VAGTERAQRTARTAPKAADRNGRIAADDVTAATGGSTSLAARPARADTRWSEIRTVFVPLIIVFPGAAAIAATVVYLMPPAFTDPRSNGVLAILAGAAFGILVWACSALLLRRLSRADGANPCVHGELVRKYLSVQARLDTVADGPEAATAAAREAALQLESVPADLGLVDSEAVIGSRWPLGSGYISAWRRLHRAEECLIVVEPVAAVVGQALQDELRLQGARMPMSASLLAKVRQAMVMVDAESSRYLDHPVRAADGSAAANAEAEARVVIRQVRHAINEFRDDRRDGLIRARNNLLGTAVYTSLIAFLVLGLAMVAGTSQRIVTAAAAYFLVGAAVGLFRHLRSASARDTEMEEDYGLATARLIQRPLFSGLAAVGGVILTALLPRLTPAGSPGTGPLTTLDQIFNLSAHPEYLVVAAVFGLTPTLLMAGLQRQAESYKADLKSSEPAEAAH